MKKTLKRISFVLPKPTFGVMGGYRVIYEYANLFVKHGYKVTIYYNMKKGNNSKKIPSLFYFVLGKIVTRVEPSWYKLNRKIKKKAIWSISNHNLKNADCVIATAVDTALGVSRLDFSKGKKIYFVQDFENWVMSDADVYKTYELNMKIITISEYLKHLIKDHVDRNVFCIPNGIDLQTIKIVRKIEERDKFSVGFLYHEAPHKGVKYAIEAIGMIRHKYPQLNVYSFGSSDAPSHLPDWVRYYGKLSSIQVNELLNRCSIFVCASINEGFGLTGAESMAAGCALVSSDYEAVHTYAENENNALLSPVMDVNSMAKNIERLIENDELRYRVAQNGNTSIQRFSWENAFNSFQRVIDED